jgi:uncharacterized membrane protein
MKRSNMILLIATTIIGLTAGIFYCWSVSVTKGLAPLPDKEYITVFQSLNREIQNPLFFLCFLGSAIILPVSAWMNFGQPVQLRFWLLLAASAAYIIGVIGVTFMNDAMDVFNVNSATAAEIAHQRITFETPWNNLNNIRTVACIISFVLTVLACFDGHDIREILVNKV